MSNINWRGVDLNLELAPKIDAVLSIIREDILQPVAFEPASYQNKIVIGLTDYAEQVFAPICLTA